MEGSHRLNLRALEARDIDAILALQLAAPEIAQWTLWDYNRVAAGEMAGWVAEHKEQLVGFLVARQIVSDVEILNFAVVPDFRRQGIGAALLGHVLGWAREVQADNALLEVRESNLAALRFYERHEFRATGRRPRYYTAPAEDALVLTLRLR